MMDVRPVVGTLFHRSPAGTTAGQSRPAWTVDTPRWAAKNRRDPECPRAGLEAADNHTRGAIRHGDERVRGPDSHREDHAALRDGPRRRTRRPRERFRL